MTSPLGLTPKVIEILVAVVTSGGEALASRLAMTCGLTKPQLTRQLNWMEGQNLINQVRSRDGRTWVRATVLGRDALRHPGESS
jgi:DNA-binding MarR family transcriptional regulator